jgi:hypothetical protein
MTRSTGTTAGESPPTAPAGGHSPARRRLLQAGISAAPVAMTLASRPVLAEGNGIVGGACRTPSAFASINQSVQHNGTTCSGRTPGFWKQEQHFSSWRPSGFYPTTVPGPGGHAATQFCAVFPNCSVYTGKTLLDVLGAGGGPPDDVGRHIVAALLNAYAGFTPLTILSVAKIKEIWSQYASTGYFSPVTGVQWDHGQIVAYLVSTMPI